MHYTPTFTHNYWKQRTETKDWSIFFDAVNQNFILDQLIMFTWYAAVAVPNVKFDGKFDRVKAVFHLGVHTTLPDGKGTTRS